MREALEAAPPEDEPFVEEPAGEMLAEPTMPETAASMQLTRGKRQSPSHMAASWKHGWP